MKTVQFFILIITLFQSGFVSAQQNTDPQNAAFTSEIISKIDQAVTNLPHQKTSASVMIYDLKNNRSLYKHNHNENITTASTSKIFTILSALHWLGQDFEFKTSLCTDGESLIIFGDGDPSIGDEKICKMTRREQYDVFDSWISVLAKNKISVIPGDIIFNDHIFDGEFLHPNWEAEDLGKWYAAPVSGLIFNNSCVDITAMPLTRQNRIITHTMPESDIIKIDNKAVVGTSKKDIATLHNQFDSNEYTIKGKVSQVWKFKAVSFPEPSKLFASSFKKRMEKSGITIFGQCKQDRKRTIEEITADELEVIATSKSPLVFSLQRIGKNSQNLFGEAVWKRTGAYYQKSRGLRETGSWESGSNAARGMLKNWRISTDNLTLVDGSGLSRDNQCSAFTMCEVLTKATSKEYFDTFLGSLSHAGEDGSLEDRMEGISGRVVAKTGTMTGVRTLAGYILDHNDEPVYSFAIMFENYPGPSRPYKRIQDKICKLLVSLIDENL